MRDSPVYMRSFPFSGDCGCWAAGRGAAPIPAAAAHLGPTRSCSQLGRGASLSPSVHSAGRSRQWVYCTLPPRNLTVVKGPCAVVVLVCCCFVCFPHFVFITVVLWFNGSWCLCICVMFVYMAPRAVSAAREDWWWDLWQLRVLTRANSFVWGVNFPKTKFKVPRFLDPRFLIAWILTTWMGRTTAAWHYTAYEHLQNVNVEDWSGPWTSVLPASTSNVRTLGFECDDEEAKWCKYPQNSAHTDAPWPREAKRM